MASAFSFIPITLFLGTALSGASPAQATDRPCNLAAIDQTIRAELPHGPRPPHLQISDIDAMRLPGYSVYDAKFPKSRILFPRALQKSTGIRSIRKIRKIGAGGIGVVYEVEVQYVGGAKRRMAWKELTYKEQSYFPIEERTLRIQNTIANVTDHGLPVDQVIRVTSQGAVSNMGILTELGGQSVHQILQAKVLKTLSNAERIRLAEIVAEQVSRTLEALRQNKLVHQDVKAENVVIFGGEKNDVHELLAGKAHLRLIDYGIVNTEGHRGRNRSGTAAYWPVEILDDPVTHRSVNDLYALGLLISEIVSEKPLTEPQWVHAGAYPRPNYSLPEIDQSFEDIGKSTASPEEKQRLENLKSYTLNILHAIPGNRPKEIFVPSDRPRPGPHSLPAAPAHQSPETPERQTVQME